MPSAIRPRQRPAPAEPFRRLRGAGWPSLLARGSPPKREGVKPPVAILLLGLLLASAPAIGEPVRTPAPGPKDTCPVCGMFVAKYPEWIATVLYKDGHAHHFDGAKDLFKYLLDLPKWAPGHSAADIAAIGVTEYYGLTRIDARQACYVIGSDTLGPMGHELVPFETREDAEGFIQDHQGKRILTFEDVTLELLEGLDKGRFP